jgi:hypothetical protein
MPDISPYGVTQNADAERVTANQLVGTAVGLITAEGIIGGAAMFSTAPYVPPRRVGSLGCVGKDGKCGAPAIRGTELCYFHTKDDGESPAAP